MKVGSLVECVNDAPTTGDWQDCTPLVRGRIYTIRAIMTPLLVGPTVVLLEEIVHKPNAYISNWEEWCYDSRHFKEVQPPMKISISEIVKQPELCQQLS